MNWTTRQSAVDETDVVNSNVAALVKGPGAFKCDRKILRHSAHYNDARTPNIFVAHSLPPQRGRLGTLSHHHIQLGFICITCPHSIHSKGLKSCLSSVHMGRNTFSIYVVIEVQSAGGAGLCHGWALQSCRAHFFSCLRFQCHVPT